MGQFHSTSKMPRSQPNKGHAIAMLGVHIGLNLKHKPSHFRFLGKNFAGLCCLYLRLWAIGFDAFHQFFHAEGIDRRAKPNRRHAALQNGLWIQGRKQTSGHFNIFAQFT